MRAWATARAWRSVSRRPARTWRSPCGGSAHDPFQRRSWSNKVRCPNTSAHAAERTLHTRRNILVSGGTGSGKTTLLNALIALIPDDERIVAIEDTLELRIDSPNCVRFEARGLQQGAVTIRDLVRHALRHRPDHIVVGEVRGGEAADLLQALNTGHGGSLTTVHANNAESALSRLASCAMQGGGDLPWEVTCRGVVDGIAMVIHMTRADGRRFVEEAAYVRGYEAGEEHMEHRTTRPHAALKACRIRRDVIVAPRGPRVAGRVGHVRACGVGRRAEVTQPRAVDVRLLNVPEVADLLRTGHKAVYAMIERGQLPGVRRIGRRILVDQRELLDWLDHSCASSPKGE